MKLHSTTGLGSVGSTGNTYICCEIIESKGWSRLRWQLFLIFLFPMWKQKLSKRSTDFYIVTFVLSLLPSQTVQSIQGTHMGKSPFGTHVHNLWCHCSACTVLCCEVTAKHLRFWKGKSSTKDKVLRKFTVIKCPSWLSLCLITHRLALAHACPGSE